MEKVHDRLQFDFITKRWEWGAYYGQLVGPGSLPGKILEEYGKGIIPAIDIINGEGPVAAPKFTFAWKAKLYRKVQSMKVGASNVIPFVKKRQVLAIVQEFSLG